MVATAHDPWHADLERLVKEALRAIRFGTVTLFVQDGHVIQIDKSEKLRLNCNSGGRSYNAYRKLQKLAYPDIAQAIFADWQDEKLPVIK